MEEETKDWMVTLKNGARMDARIASTILDELSCLKTRYDHEFKVLYELFETGHGSDPQVITEFKKAGLILEKNGQLKSDAKNVFEAALRNSRGQAVEDPFLRECPDEQETLKRIKMQEDEGPANIMFSAFAPKKMRGILVRDIRDAKRVEGIDPGNR